MSASFKHLISVLCHEHTLTLSRNDKLELHTDASTKGIGAVLSVIREDMEKPVAYYLKGLTAAEKNYTVSELECLAVVKAIDHFAIHLLGCFFFTVVTNHRALVTLQDWSRLNGCLMISALALQVFDFVLKFRPGIHHQNADGLSRQCWSGDDPAKTPSTVDLVTDDEAMTTGPRLTQEVTSTGRGPKPEARGPKPETRGSKPEARGPKPEARGPKPEARGPKPEARGPKPEARGPKPEARGPKPEERAPSLGGGVVKGSPQHCPRTIKMALRPEHLA